MNLNSLYFTSYITVIWMNTHVSILKQSKHYIKTMTTNQWNSLYFITANKYVCCVLCYGFTGRSRSYNTSVWKY